MPGSLTPASLTGGRRGVSVKTLKKLLKKAGLKTTGRKAALTRRAKKAHLKMRGGVELEGEKGQGQSSAEEMLGAPLETEDKGGRRRRSRRSRKGLFGY